MAFCQSKFIIFFPEKSICLLIRWTDSWKWETAARGEHVASHCKWIWGHACIWFKGLSASQHNASQSLITTSSREPSHPGYFCIYDSEKNSSLTHLFHISYFIIIFVDEMTEWIQEFPFKIKKKLGYKNIAIVHYAEKFRRKNRLGSWLVPKSVQTTKHLHLTLLLLILFLCLT